MQVIDLEISKAQGCCKPYFNIKVILLLLIKKKRKNSQLNNHNLKFITGKRGKKRELIPCDVQWPAVKQTKLSGSRTTEKKKEKEKKIAHNLH